MCTLLVLFSTRLSFYCYPDYFQRVPDTMFFRPEDSETIMFCISGITLSVIVELMALFI